VWITSSLTTALTPTSVALGNFDGVHRGHQQVIKPILQESQAVPGKLYIPGAEDDSSQLVNLDAANQLQTPIHAYSTVATFNPHPREFFSGKS
jgi:riboflavin kinase/FMN adenylyltransferase